MVEGGRRRGLESANSVPVVADGDGPKYGERIRRPDEGWSSLIQPTLACWRCDHTSVSERSPRDRGRAARAWPRRSSAVVPPDLRVSRPAHPPRAYAASNTVLEMSKVLCWLVSRATRSRAVPRARWKLCSPVGPDVAPSSRGRASPPESPPTRRACERRSLAAPLRWCSPEPVSSGPVFPLAATTRVSSSTPRARREMLPHRDGAGSRDGSEAQSRSGHPFLPMLPVASVSLSSSFRRCGRRPSRTRRSAQHPEFVVDLSSRGRGHGDALRGGSR